MYTEMTEILIFLLIDKKKNSSRSARNQQRIISSTFLVLKCIYRNLPRFQCRFPHRNLQVHKKLSYGNSGHEFLYGIKQEPS